MAKNKVPIHLWDNSWHIQETNDSSRDRYGRKPLVVKYRGATEILRHLSSFTISEIMKDEETYVLVWPQSFIKGYEAIKDQYIFQITEKDRKNIDSITTGNIVGFIGKDKTDIRIHSRFSAIDEKKKR